MSLSAIGQPARESIRSWFPRLLALFACFLPAPILCETKSAPSDRHVVVVVWDGMRPDFVSERNSPTLWKLARAGGTATMGGALTPQLQITLRSI